MLARTPSHPSQRAQHNSLPPTTVTQEIKHRIILAQREWFVGKAKLKRHTF